MKKIIKSKEMDAAARLCNYHCANSNFRSHGQIVRANYLLVLEDDPDSVFMAVRLYFQIRAAYLYCPQIICVDVKTNISEFWCDSVGRRNTQLCHSLGVDYENIITTCQSKNLQESLEAVENIVKTDKVIACLSQRFSGLFAVAQEKFAPNLNCYYAVKQSFYISEECHWYNIRVIGRCALMLQEVSALSHNIRQIVGRSYAEWKRQTPQRVLDAEAFLRKRYHLFLPKNYWQRLTDFFRRLYYYNEVMRNREKISESLTKAIVNQAKYLWQNKLVAPDEIPDFHPNKLLAPDKISNFHPKEKGEGKVYWHYHKNEPMQ